MQEKIHNLFLEDFYRLFCYTDVTIIKTCLLRRKRYHEDTAFRG